MAKKTVRTKVDLGFQGQQLEGLIQACSTDPAAAKTVWQAKSHWKKGFQSEAQIRQHTVPMDEPTVLGGSDTGPNMVEMVLGAYGSCLTTGYVMNAALQGIKLEGVEIKVEGNLDLRGFFDLDPKTSPGYTNVRAKVHLKAPGATREQLRRLHDLVVRTSPVGAIIARPVPIQAELAQE